MALPKKNRLIKNKDFEGIFKEGKSVKGSFLFIKFRKKDGQIPRISPIISSKTVPKAVDRNRLKRVFSEVIRKFIKENNLGGYDAAVILSKKAGEDILIAELKGLLNNIWPK